MWVKDEVVPNYFFFGFLVAPVVSYSVKEVDWLGALGDCEGEWFLDINKFWCDTSGKFLWCCKNCEVKIRFYRDCHLGSKINFVAVPSQVCILLCLCIVVPEW